MNTAVRLGDLRFDKNVKKSAKSCYINEKKCTFAAENETKMRINFNFCAAEVGVTISVCDR